MPSEVFATARSEFEASLSDVEENLSFVENAAWLRPRLGELIHWNFPDDTRIRCQTFMDQKGVQPDVMFGGLYVSVAGAFEQLIRRTVRDAIVHISNRTPRYVDLSADIVRQNLRYSGQALATILDPPTHFDLNYGGLCVGLGTCIENSESVSLNAEAFALFFTTLTPRKLEDVLRRIGVKFDWLAIGRDLPVRDALGTTKTAQTASAAERFLKEFIDRRNKLAHTGSGGASVSSAQLQDSIRFFRAFANALLEQLDSQLLS